LIILVAGAYFGPQSVTYWRWRSAGLLRRPSDSPPRGWSSVPRPLDDVSVSSAEGTVLSYFGYRFEVPWKDPEKGLNEGRWAQVTFKSGQTVRAINPTISQDNPIGGPVAQDYAVYFKEAFGEGVHRSKYEQFKAVLSVAPSQLSPFVSRREFARVIILLGIKSVWFEHDVAAPDIFSFESRTYRGFEFSGLSHDWQQVGLTLFDRTDRCFVIGVSGGARSDVRLTQSEINRIIQSFRVVSPK
jgi:hypothetical protein